MTQNQQITANIQGLSNQYPKKSLHLLFFSFIGNGAENDNILPAIEAQDIGRQIVAPDNNDYASILHDFRADVPATVKNGV